MDLILSLLALAQDIDHPLARRHVRRAANLLAAEQWAAEAAGVAPGLTAASPRLYRPGTPGRATAQMRNGDRPA